VGMRITPARRGAPDIGPKPVAHPGHGPPEDRRIASRGKTGSIVAVDPRDGGRTGICVQPHLRPGKVHTRPQEGRMARAQQRPGTSAAEQGQRRRLPAGIDLQGLCRPCRAAGRDDNPGEHLQLPRLPCVRRPPLPLLARPRHGSMELERAIIQSCDVFFYQTGLKLGVDRLGPVRKHVRPRRETGIGLQGEHPGLIPTSCGKSRPRACPGSAAKRSRFPSARGST